MKFDPASPWHLPGKLLLALIAIGCVNFVGRPVSAQSKVGNEGGNEGAKPSVHFTDQQLDFFENKVRPLLVDKCYDCHGPDATPLEGSLSLSSRKSILSGGDTGPAIAPGQPEESLLIDAINYGEVYEMPPDTKMSDEEIAILTKWVKLGAAWPTDSDVEVATKSEFDLEGRKSAHWCWQPIRKQSVPSVKNDPWPKDPIDNFILSRLEGAGLTPAEPANRRTLIRRAYFDIIGLPPTPEQVNAFVADESPKAFEKVIDELLASPRYGERWARHWMDLTRYAETGGHEFDYEIHHAFRYRDYLIRAFNEDISYRQLVHEHIAGDLLTSPRRHPTEDFNESILGTGFWFLGEAKHAPVDSKGEEARTIDNQLDVMSKTFMALTVACARCHDHKFDAISTEDYYALSGFLQSSRRQVAMLDPGKKIEKIYEKESRLVDQGNQIAARLIAQLEDADKTVVARYISASLEFLRSDPEWNKPAAIFLEGESLKQVEVSGGETSMQKSRKRKQTAWRGDQQYWWKQGAVGDAWLLEFAISPDHKLYEVNAVFTKAPDYGAAKLLINDKVVTDHVDFFDSELGTVNLSLGKMQLHPGRNELKIVLADPNEAANPGNSVGLDYIQLSPVSNPSGTEVASIESLAVDGKLDSELLERFVSAIRDPAAQNPAHPIHLIFQASHQSQPVDSSFGSELAKKAAADESRHGKWLDESMLFEDFENGLPSGWFETGLAFGETLASGSSKLASMFAANGPFIHESGTVHSGKYAGNLYGVIRSPTFELEHTHIHYRCRGSNVTIRLVIDGYIMDEFNALLFKGCRFKIRNSEYFQWETQAGDIRNHVGSRAHIEIIDHGGGFIELDEIRFSNGATPIDPPTGLAGSSASGDIDSPASIANAFAGALTAQPVNRELANWIISNQLIPVFSKPVAFRVSPGRTRLDLKNVSVSTRGSKDGAIETPAGLGLAKDLQSLRSQLSELNVQTPAPDLAIAITEGTGEEERIFIRGNHKTLGDVATRRFLSAISGRSLNPSDGSGRLQLAYKITAPNNPLTNRVAVNRIWHHMLGRGIVGSVDNFGVLGKTPTHPELLDYLATEFASDGQSFKRMIRRIALSRTYQMASQPTESGSRLDPDNDLLHRARIRRLQGEAIRDSFLQVSGNLDLKMFGPPVPIHLTSFMGGRGRPGKSGPLNGAGRRSVYVAVRRNFLSPMMLAFDTPIPFNSTGARNQSNVPAQALILMNDPFVIEQAKRWAERIVTTDQTSTQRIEAIYQTALGRPPSEQESGRALSFIEQQAAEVGIDQTKINTSVEVWQDVCHVVFNLKEFIYIQ